MNGGDLSFALDARPTAHAHDDAAAASQSPRLIRLPADTTRHPSPPPYTCTDPHHGQGTLGRGNRRLLLGVAGRRRWYVRWMVVVDRSCAPAALAEAIRYACSPTDPITTIPEWRITNPRVEYLAEPFATGIDVPAPRFGWVIDPFDDAAGGWEPAYPSIGPARIVHSVAHGPGWWLWAFDRRAVHNHEQQTTHKHSQRPFRARGRRPSSWW